MSTYRQATPFHVEPTGSGVAMQDSMQSSFPLTNLMYAAAPEVSLFSPIELSRTEAEERKLDQILADSFPASDPPPWTFGRARADQIDKAAIAPASSRADLTRAVADTRVPSLHTTDVIVAGGCRTFGQRLASGVGALGVALLVPIGMLIVGLPIALAVRGLLEVAAWLTPLILR